MPITRCLPPGGATTGEALKDPEDNLSCAVRIMNVTVPLFYHNVLQGDYQRYVGGAYHATEMFNFSGPLENLTDSTEDYAVLGLMGPDAARIITEAGAPELTRLGYFKVGPAHIAGCHVRAVRMSYVGEPGWEITMRAENAPAVYAVLTAAGAKPAGLYA